MLRNHFSPRIGLDVHKWALRSVDGKGLGSLPVASALFSFGVCLSFVHDSRPSLSRHSAADEKRLSEVFTMQAPLENMSSWQPQGYLTKQHLDITDHRSTFLNAEQASAMSTEPKSIFVCLFLMLYPSVQSS